MRAKVIPIRGTLARPEPPRTAPVAAPNALTQLVQVLTVIGMIAWAFSIVKFLLG